MRHLDVYSLVIGRAIEIIARQSSPGSGDPMNYRHPFSKYGAFHACAFVLAFGLVGRAAEPFPDFPVRLARDYPNFVTHNGLEAAAVAIENTADQKTYFRSELTSKGFVPVLVVLENRAPEGSYLLQKEGIKYTLGDRESSAATPDVHSKADSAASLVTPIFLFTKLISNASQVQQNLLTKELRSLTLSPGVSAHGFLYIAVAPGPHREKIHLHLPFARSGTSEMVNLELIL